MNGAGAKMTEEASAWKNCRVFALFTSFSGDAFYLSLEQDCSLCRALHGGVWVDTVEPRGG